ncbi:hypothetical protein RY831_03260 [Noviherbaspirillum sp. CPCC 100848]|uniref:Uncharacterized protein n=1 Tax=Noviherbaspirillum album TaxID=3080276 RepID=A0ABU6J3D9_9BURK|nr:hypothetical protein [Noviherbaspirillum sp. CPCC 100848]MEC4718151.1 hypothetical protein [Noviherbaspirillum sp. CPCC 100848]
MRQEPKIMIVLGLLAISLAALAVKFDATPSGVVAGLVGLVSIAFGIADQIFGSE